MSRSVIATSPPSRRFDWVTSGQRVGGDAPFDVDVGDFEPAAVVPTKGALVPEWLLIVPRLKALSVADLSAHERRKVLACAREVSEQIAKVADDVVLFEHGPRKQGAANGCGVDQAHIHVIGLDKRFLSFVFQTTANDLRWELAAGADPWDGVPEQSDYIVLMRGELAWRALTPEPTSQFMRRRIASFVGTPGEWDYRRYPHAANAERTKSLFRFGNGP